MEKIEQYLLGQLDADEARAFETAVAQDEALARELETRRLELDLLLQLEADALRAKVRELQQRKNTGHPTHTPILRKLYSGIDRWKVALAAASIALIVALVYWLNLNTPRETINLACQKAVIIQAGQFKGPAQRQAFEMDKTAILEKWDESRAETAVRYFSAYASPDTTLQRAAQLKLAQALILARKYEQAVRLLDVLEPLLSPDDRYAAQYFKVWAAYGSGQTEQARELLTQIARDTAHPFQPEAQRFLPKLKQE